MRGNDAARRLLRSLVATLVLLFVVMVQTYTLLDKVIATKNDNILTVELNLPTWPVEGTWFFNPLAWQLLIVLGFLCCRGSRNSERFRAWMKRLMPLGLNGTA